MMKHKGLSEKAVNVIMWLYASFTLFVLGYLVYNSLRPKSEILGNTLGKPKEFTFENFTELFTDDNFGMFFLNSVIVLVFSLFLLILLSSMVAYGLGRYTFKYNRHLRVFFLLGMMFPIQLGIVPVFLLMKNLDLVNSYLSVILLLGTGISLPVFILTTFFSGLPKELYEAAVLDGAGEWKIFSRIMFPLARPVIFSVCIVSSVQIWNQFFIPLIFLQSEEKKTLPLLMMKYNNHLFNHIDMAMAASVMSVIPILIIFIIFSKRILEGFASGAIKG